MPKPTKKTNRMTPYDISTEKTIKALEAKHREACEHYFQQGVLKGQEDYKKKLTTEFQQQSFEDFVFLFVCASKIVKEFRERLDLTDVKADYDLEARKAGLFFVIKTSDDANELEFCNALSKISSDYLSTRGFYPNIEYININRFKYSPTYVDSVYPLSLPIAVLLDE